MLGQIIIINGTSGSGKSTTCDLFAKQSNDFWLTYGVDQFMGSTFPKQFGHHGQRCDQGICARPLSPSDPEGTLRWHFTDQAMQAFGVFHEWIASASRQGCNIIIDHLMMVDPPILQDCIWRLTGLPVFFVNLKPSYEVLSERVANREIGNRFSNSSYSNRQIEESKQRLARLRPWFYQAVYANSLYDLEVDSEKLTPEEICAAIQRQLPLSLADDTSAFGLLRQQYDNPLQKLG